MPSRSRLRTVAVSIRCDIPGMLRFRSENRPRNAGLPLRMKITNRLHLSPTRLSMSRKPQSWWLLSSAILFARCAGWAAFGVLLLIPTMVGAVFTHLFIVGGSAVPATVLLIGSLAIAWARREQVARVLSRRS